MHAVLVASSSLSCFGKLINPSDSLHYVLPSDCLSVEEHLPYGYGLELGLMED